MNEKPPGVLRNIFHKSWHEPRRFFFWLALLSSFVFAMLLLVAAMSPRIPAFIHWIALGAILGLIIGVPSFVLAWIPPLRRLFTRLLQHKLLIVAGIITLIAAFYAVENWRGRKAWNSFQREWEAQGVPFTIEKIIPPPVAPEENMYEAEPWIGFHFTTTNGVRYQNTNVHNETWLDCSGPNSANAPQGADLFLARPTDLEAWQFFYRGSNNIFATAGSPTNYFPIAATAQTPAQDVLLALSKSDAYLAQIRAAAQRPHARFWINYEDGFGALLPHLSKIKNHANYFRLHATALLAENQSDAALNDVLLSFRLNDALRTEPTLISQLVRIAAFHINLTPIWEGLGSHRWSENQLTTLDRELAKMDFLTDYQTGMNGERYFSTWTMDFLRRTGDVNSISESPAPGSEASFSDQLLAANGKILFRLVPTGWFDQNKLSLGRMHTELIRPMVDVEKLLVLPADSARVRAAIDGWHPTPYNLFTGMLLPALDKTAEKSARAQTYLNLARIAIALERHRLINGQFPEALEALVPKFITQLPHDVINGQPLKYRRMDDGSFILYSVGWNEADDGGAVGLNKDGKSTDLKKGDWVWRYPAK